MISLEITRCKLDEMMESETQLDVFVDYYLKNLDIRAVLEPLELDLKLGDEESS